MVVQEKKQLTMLIVEDNTNIKEIYSKFFEKKYKVYSEEDGKKAYKLAVEKKPDIILLDLMLPSITGFDLIGMFRSTEGLKDAIIIVLSALNQKDQVVLCMQNGADDYMVKPASFVKLQYRIEVLLEKKATAKKAD